MLPQKNESWAGCNSCVIESALKTKTKGTQSAQVQSPCQNFFGGEGAHPLFWGGHPLKMVIFSALYAMWGGTGFMCSSLALHRAVLVLCTWCSPVPVCSAASIMQRNVNCFAFATSKKKLCSRLTNTSYGKHCKQS